MLNYLHGYKRLCCQNLAYRQTEIKWSFFVEHLNLWYAGTHESHENWYTTNKNEFTVQLTLVISNSMGPWKKFESTVVRLKRGYEDTGSVVCLTTKGRQLERNF